MTPPTEAPRETRELQPGQFEVRDVQWEPGVRGPMLFYGCPLGRGRCGVPLQPSPPNSAGCSWQWDGNREAPTLSPSINCNATDKDGKLIGCGWHGFMRAGVLAP